MLEASPCPCGSGELYPFCCGLYHSRQQPAPNAELLMRSRYCGYVLRNERYLLATWHPSTRPATLNLPTDRQWLGLTVLGKGTEGDGESWVEFTARFSEMGRVAWLKERSHFVKEGGQWYYVDGVSENIVSAPQARIGRNAPCPCGSGRKYKRCCA